MKKNKKVVIGFFAVLLLIAGANLLFASDTKKEKAVTQEKAGTVAQETEKAEDPLAETKKATQNLYRDKISPIGTGDEYPSEETNGLKTKLIQYAKDGNYRGLINEAESLVEEYTFSSMENLDIAGFVQDATILKDLAAETNMETFGKAVAQSKTPEFLVLNTLYSENFSRRQVIKDEQSLAPIGYSKVLMDNRRVIHSAEEGEGEERYKGRNIPADIFEFEDNVIEIFAFDITIPELFELPLTAYVYEDLYGKLHMYGFYAPDDFETYEQTLAWYKEQDGFYEDAQKKQEEFYEDAAKDGKITNEQIDKLFESGY